MALFFNVNVNFETFNVTLYYLYLWVFLLTHQFARTNDLFNIRNRLFSPFIINLLFIF